MIDTEELLNFKQIIEQYDDAALTRLQELLRIHRLEEYASACISAITDEKIRRANPQQGNIETWRRNLLQDRANGNLNSTSKKC